MESQGRFLVKDVRLTRKRGGCLHVHCREVLVEFPRPVVVLSHGFVTTGVENHRLFMRVARALNEAGYSSVLFDYYGCGYSDGDYEEFLLSTAAEDLSMVSRWAVESVACDGSVVLFGQSLGTASCVLACNGGEIPLVGMVLWNLTGDIERRYAQIYNVERDPRGAVCIQPKGDYIGSGFVRDASVFDVEREFERIVVPVLLLSCAGDAIGDIHLAERAAGACKAPVDREVLSEATHSFVGQRDLERAAISASLGWLTRLLARVSARHSTL